MHLFCIKPFHSDNSPKDADKYKFQRQDGCIYALDMKVTVIFQLRYFLLYNKAFWNSACIWMSRSLFLKMIFFHHLKKHLHNVKGTSHATVKKTEIKAWGD